MRRLMLDMSQTEVATALGLTFQQLQRYERDVNRVGASRLQQLSGLLGRGLLGRIWRAVGLSGRCGIVPPELTAYVVLKCAGVRIDGR
jgi:transcriptional regulator with XRE-family HTH domain